MRGQSEFRNSIVFTISFAAAVSLLVLLVVVATRAQNPVPPTARQAAAAPAFAAKLHPSAPPAVSKARAPASARDTLESRQSPSCSGRYSPASGSGVIYDNGPANGTTDAWTINFGYIVSDTFVPSGIPVYGFDLYVWEIPGDVLSSVQWSITSGPNSGTVYGSGTVSGSNLTDTFISTNQYGYDIDKISASGLNVTVTSGSTYWVNVFNASVPSGDPVYWDENSGKGCNSSGCPSQAVESAVGTIASEAFDITGGVPPPPPPTCYGSGGKFQIIHDFTQQEVGVGGAGGVTTDEAGKLYGTTTYGGANGVGLVYQLSPKGQGWVLNPLYSFLGGSSGSGPSPVILGPDRALYGTAAGGLGNGLVYSLRPGPTACLTALCSWTENPLYEFADGASAGGIAAFDQAGNLYGTSVQGGAYGYGAIFELTPSPSGWTEKILYSFTGGNDGISPDSLLMGNDGDLYGTTFYGGAYGAGTVFQLAPSGDSWTKTVLYNFTGDSGDTGGPGNLIQDGSGNLYGAACGGCYSGPNDYVTVFMLSPSNGKWVFTVLWQRVLYVGMGGGGINNLTIDAAGNLYGTAAFDLYYDCGHGRNAYIFKLVPQGSGWQFIYLAPFGSSYFNSTGTLALDAQGDLYGTSASCGKYGYGTVWEVSP